MYHFDRDLSWMQFNQRVLEQADRRDVPYSERLSFIGIAASNLDEFVSVRLMKALKRYAADNVPEVAEDLLNEIKSMKSEISEKFTTMISGLFRGTPQDDISNYERKVFCEEVFPSLTPITLGSNKEIPRLNGNDVNFFVKIENEDNNEYCFVQIPFQLSRVFKIRKDYLVLIEELVRDNFGVLFGDKKITYLMFKVTKKADVKMSLDNSVSIVDRVNDVIRTREENNILYLDVMTYDGMTEEENEKLITKLRKIFKIGKNHIHVIHKENDETLGLQFLKSKPFEKYLSRLYPEEIPVDQWNPKFKPKLPAELVDEKSIFDVLDDRDLLVHHPYETYDVVIRFIKEAALDPNVISIKQTLYRVSSSKSPIIKALCAAADTGKRVTVMLELLARFDEKQNITLINKLKRSGVNIVYSSSKKTHCKLCLVTKVTKKGNLKTYCHIGTGNYNEKTAQIYTDLSFFTSKRVYARDLNQIFNMITGFGNIDSSVVVYSPVTLRTTIQDCIKIVTAYGGSIRIKVNALSDNEIETLLGNAEQARIDIKILCRGVCSLIPTRSNLQIRSIIGRFLEHSRIYIFNWAEGETKYQLVFISSADLLTRNLDKRIEVMTMISSRKCAAKVIDIFDKMWLDEKNAYEIIEADECGKTYAKIEGERNIQNELTM